MLAPFFAKQDGIGGENDVSGLEVFQRGSVDHGEVALETSMINAGLSES